MRSNKLIKIKWFRHKGKFAEVDFVKKEIRVNFSDIWKFSPRIDHFIKLFSHSISHEYIHLAIEEALPSSKFSRRGRGIIGEEWAVARLLGDKFDGKDTREYEKIYRLRHKR
jgi:hypothetical protein